MQATKTSLHALLRHHCNHSGFQSKRGHLLYRLGLPLEVSRSCTIVSAFPKLRCASSAVTKKPEASVTYFNLVVVWWPAFWVCVEDTAKASFFSGTERMGPTFQVPGLGLLPNDSKVNLEAAYASLLRSCRKHSILAERCRV
ncbi:hypothetical protein BDV98DRAFT_567540 [Pterulicium gracile]|uniref:Uncharacterized protein n=1 Tax=Pterulicium gracile TaxID=1884261 RepID=A0A5C3QKV7_9AGAR|nr:hypothetical protein BDV98DRAFT_567540 [Pterula gracilis]